MMKIAKQKGERKFFDLFHKQTPDNAEPDVKMVKCPYCHSEFDINDVLFRAETPVSEEKVAEIKKALKDIENKLMLGEINELDAAGLMKKLTEELSKSEKYVAKTDEALQRFWLNKMGWGNTPQNIREFEWDYSEINKKTTGGIPISEVKCCILNEIQIKERHCNEDGHVFEVTDSRGVKTQKRICPDCHCLLPRDYGAYDIFFISVIGIRGSGKTVLLSKFLQEANDLLINAGITALQTETSERFVEEKMIEKGVRLPEHTDRETFKPPIFLTVFDADNKFYTCVFYDIAGENCRTIQAMGDKGFFIGNSDGIIMLVAPQQIEGLILAEADGDADAGNIDITDVFDTVASTYAQYDIRRTGKKGKAKFAVTISKSDVLQYAQKDDEPVAEAGSNFFKNVRYKNGYMKAQHENLQGEIIKLLSGTPLAATISRFYKDVSYFAVSTLGTRPVVDAEGTQIAPDGQCIRLEEPFVWMLHELGVIPVSREGDLFDR